MEDLKEVYKEMIDQANPALVTIHKYVTIGRGSRVLTHCPYRAYTSNPFTILKDYVWIGWNCAIAMGVTLHHASFIGTMSVVTRDCDPFTINVGNPARFLRMRDGAEMLRTLCAIKMFDASGLVPDHKLKWQLLTDKDIRRLFKLPRKRINDDDPMVPLEELLRKKQGLSSSQFPEYINFNIWDVLEAYGISIDGIKKPKGKRVRKKGRSYYVEDRSTPTS